MKNLSIILACLLVAMMSCTKSKEVHPEIGDGNDEIITVGMKDVYVKYMRTDIAELQKVVFHYSIAETLQFYAAEMTKKDCFELTLNDLLSDTLYCYYYELFPNNGDAFQSEQKTFRTQAFETPEPPTPPTPPSGEHEYVDLGLPSGLLWATCNLGATTPEGYGDYFAWGETRAKDSYSPGNYKYFLNYFITKYCNNPSFGFDGFTDELTVLLPEDDAATINWGADWRMPTIEEWQELINNTTSTWTTYNGVNGRLFMASNGNSLFLPATGVFLLELNGFGETADYWSSSLNIDHALTSWMFFFQNDLYECVDGDRDNGKSVRPVRSTH